VEKSKEHGNNFVLNYAAPHKYVLGSGCGVLSIVDAVLDNSD
jgi:hypothetical protein